MQTFLFRAFLVFLTSSTLACGSSSSPGSDAATGQDAAGDAPADAAADRTASPDAATAAGLPAAFVHLCSLTEACSFGPVLTAPITGCIAALQQRVLPTSWDGPSEQTIARLLQCAGSSTTCASFVACGTLGVPACTAASETCSGQIRVKCSFANDNVPEIVDCAALGATCMAGQCVAPSTGAVCTQLGAARCSGSGGGILACLSDGAGGFREAAASCPGSSVCQAIATSVICAPAALAPCTTPGKTCVGNVLTNCADLSGAGTNLRALTSDCTAMGRTCGPDVTMTAQPGVPVSPACNPTGTACTVALPGAPSTTVCSSSGDGIDACVDGYSQHIDCPTFGTTTCAVVTAFPICR